MIIILFACTIAAGIGIGIWCASGPRPANVKRAHHALKRLGGYVVRYFVARSVFDWIWRR